MAAAVVQTYSTFSADWSAGVGGVAFTGLAADGTAGNLIEVAVHVGNSLRTVSSITQSGGTTYTHKERIQGDGGTLEVWYGIASGSDAGQNLTITTSGNTGDGGSVIVTEYSGLATDQTSAVDNEANFGVATTAHNSGSVTPPNATSATAYIQARTPGTWTDDSAFTYISGSQAANTPYGRSLNSGSAIEANNTAEDNEISTMLIWSWAGASGAAAPTITDVDEDDTITLEQQNVSIDIANGSSAVAQIRQGGFTYGLNEDSSGASEVVADMIVIGTTGPVSAPHAGSATAAVVNGDAQEGTKAITITDRSGSDTVLVGTPHADADERLTGTDDVEAGDYVMWFNVQGGAIGDVTVNADLTFDVDEAVTAFDFQIWDAGDGTWGDAATQNTAEPPDSVPDAFSFTDASNQPTSTVVTSDSITPAGYDSAAISVTGGSYSLNGGAFTSSSGTITAGDTLRARGTSSGSAGTTVNVVVTIGGVSDTFSITTTFAAGGTSKFRTLMGVG